ncbi:uncharacterized protein N7496_011093 [Penicillium cataractarum]|uniref:WD40 repeat-like protein n=1 Tax=Penicillium cataractarum TaxID=2100454 RepID=A0A9W9RFN6_9EURO|nr:uncharacterized protein N7496_011093 [Penicillium cataractarum]KAJ5358680.1 hypothetical protein N7496_011093 [Penicillium cataractarum]
MAPDPDNTQTFDGHVASVKSVAISPDGAHMVSGSDDTRIRIWDTNSGSCLKILKGHGYGVNSVAFSPKGDKVASGSDDGTVKIWDAEKGACLRTLESSSEVLIWDVKDGSCEKILEGHTERVYSMAFFPDDTNRIASCSMDHTIKIWDVNTAKCLATLPGHKDWVFSITFIFQENKTLLASASRDKTVKVWDAGDPSNAKCIHTFNGHNDWIRTISSSPYGNYVVSGSDDTTVKAWRTGRCVRTIKNAKPINSVCFSPDSTRLVSGSSDGTVKIWDSNNGSCLHDLKGHLSSVRSLCFLNGKDTRVASGSEDNTIRIWQVESGECSKILKPWHSDTGITAVASNGPHLVSGSDEVRIWDAVSGECLHILEARSEGANAVAISPDGVLLASCSDNGTVNLWKSLDGSWFPFREIGSENVQATSVSFSPSNSSCSTRLAVGYAAYMPPDRILKRAVIISDVKTGNELHCFPHKALDDDDYGGVTSVSFSPDNAYLAFASNDSGSPITISGMDDKPFKMILKGHRDIPESVSFSPDGKCLASGSEDCSIKIWDTTSMGKAWFD